ncbi:VacJ-like lipoprotein [Marinicauda salina]|uniref:VacJ-like lipoprotein n=2 Tax=Marinicauda salina TaxID=2135793 RepID=A0A2U2BV58_9PROT|nr:VacJ-like lipoprotein [Marinicauda salina]
MLACVSLGVAACATSPEAIEANDPLEPLNRRIYAVNEGFDSVLLEPASDAYAAVAPDPVESGVRNFMTNLNQPVVFANTVLQGRFRDAGQTAARFGLNTVFGLGGFVDVADREGVPEHHEDFGQTLAVWGVGEGPYLMLPVFGPSNIRDGVGRVVDRYPHVLNWDAEFSDSTAAWTTRGVNGLSWRSQQDELFESMDRTAIDPYVQLRSAWRQSRAAAIRDEGDDGFDDLPDFE